jgi:hypothetical protein
MDISACKGPNMTQFYGTSGVVNAFINKETFTGTFSSCVFHISVLTNMYLKAYGQFVETDTEPCNGPTIVRVNDKNEFSVVAHIAGFKEEKALFACLERQPTLTGLKIDFYYIKETTSPLILAKGNTVFVLIEDTSLPADFRIHFTALAKNRLVGGFDTVNTSQTAGYLTLPGFSEHLKYPMGLKLFQKIDLPPDHLLMLSFAEFKVYNRYMAELSPSSVEVIYPCTRNDFLEVSELSSNGVTRTIWTLCAYKSPDPTLFNTSVVISFTSTVEVTFIARKLATGFKLLFSMHPSSESITQLPSGLFNCSQHYEAFRQHLDCNVKLECEGGEDETEACPYTSHLCPPESLFIQVTAE